MHITKIGIFLAAAALCLSCGKTKDDGNPGNGGGGGLKSTSWTGIFTPSQGEDRKPIKVNFHFHESDTFSLSQIENLSSTVKGTYRDMPKHKSLLLEIKESSFKMFGEPGSSRDLTYSREDNELALSGNEGQYKLIQDNTDGENKETKSLFEGDWQCVPGDGSTWKINIGGVAFRASKAVKGKKTVFFEGDVENPIQKEKQAAAKLKVKSSNYSSLIDKRMAIEIKNDPNSLTLTELDANGNQAPNTRPVPCTKAE